MRSVGEERVRRTRLTAEQRRESIVLAAIEVFTATGYRAGRVADVAAKIGVSETDEHVGSVADLLAHALSPAPLQRLHAPGAHHLLFAEAITLSAEPDLPEPARRVVQTVADHLAELLRRGQDEGDIRPDLDADAAVWLLLSILSARPFRANTMPGADRLEKDVVGLALRAVVGPEQSPTPSGPGHHQDHKAWPEPSASEVREGLSDR
jgi:AcrR family transcriptional regulator